MQQSAPLKVRPSLSSDVFRCVQVCSVIVYWCLLYLWNDLLRLVGWVCTVLPLCLHFINILDNTEADRLLLSKVHRYPKVTYTILHIHTHTVVDRRCDWQAILQWRKKWRKRSRSSMSLLKVGSSIQCFSLVETSSHEITWACFKTISTVCWAYLETQYVMSYLRMNTHQTIPNTHK